MRLGRVSLPLTIRGAALVLAFAGAGLAIAADRTLSWMESAGFCASCHAMRPQAAAFELSPHRGVECGDCHIAPGLDGLLAAKLRGLVQLGETLTGRSPTRIEPAAHQMARSGLVANCLRCHREAPSGRDVLVERRAFAEDAANTEHRVDIVLRVAQPASSRTRGVHWHVAAGVEYLHAGEDERTIDYVRVTSPNGAVAEYARSSRARGAALDRPRGLRPGSLETMTCLTCHNRTGHEFRSASVAVDEALRDGKLDRSLPFIKREAMSVLTAGYASMAEAQAAIAGFPDRYAAVEPDTYEARRGAVAEAAQALARLYPTIASPEQLLTSRDYPTFLGHRDGGGCFRCHDGTFEKVGEPGRRIPSGCGTCHTVPQLDRAQPADAPSHPESILFDHAAVIRVQGTATCALCHEPPACARCHAREVLGRP